MEALLARFSEIAGPGSGAPIILAALARMGTTACEWIDGELRIELSGNKTQTTISVSTSIGAGFREKLFSDTVLRVPLAEFSLGIARAPRLIEPLGVTETGTRIVLTVSQDVRQTSLPPPMIRIDPTSLMVVPPMAVPAGLQNEQPSMPGPAAPAPPPSPPAAPRPPVLRKRIKDGT